MRGYFKKCQIYNSNLCFVFHVNLYFYILVHLHVHGYTCVTSLVDWCHVVKPDRARLLPMSFHLSIWDPLVCNRCEYVCACSSHVCMRMCWRPASQTNPPMKPPLEPSQFLNKPRLGKAQKLGATFFRKLEVRYTYPQVCMHVESIPFPVAPRELHVTNWVDFWNRLVKLIIVPQHCVKPITMALSIAKCNIEQGNPIIIRTVNNIISCGW